MQNGLILNDYTTNRMDLCVLSNFENWGIFGPELWAKTPAEIKKKIRYFWRNVNMRFFGHFSAVCVRNGFILGGWTTQGADLGMSGGFWAKRCFWAFWWGRMGCQQMVKMRILTQMEENKKAVFK